MSPVAVVAIGLTYEDGCLKQGLPQAPGINYQRFNLVNSRSILMQYVIAALRPYRLVCRIDGGHIHENGRCVANITQIDD
jgi:hypothetical protein